MKFCWLSSLSLLSVLCFRYRAERYLLSVYSGMHVRWLRDSHLSLRYFVLEICESFFVSLPFQWLGLFSYSIDACVFIVFSGSFLFHYFD